MSSHAKRYTRSNSGLAAGDRKSWSPPKLVEIGNLTIVHNGKLGGADGRERLTRARDAAVIGKFPLPTQFQIPRLRGPVFPDR